MFSLNELDNASPFQTQTLPRILLHRRLSHILPSLYLEKTQCRIQIEINNNRKIKNKTKEILSNLGICVETSMSTPSRILNFENHTFQNNDDD